MEECPICMDSLTGDRSTTTLRCGHTFHVDCIVQALRRSALCPMCRDKGFDEPSQFFDVVSSPEPPQQEPHREASFDMSKLQAAVTLLVAVLKVCGCMPDRMAWSNGTVSFRML